MKKIKLVLLTGVLLAGIAAKAQTADEIVDKWLTAVGGETAWKNINTMKITGSLNQRGFEISMTQIINKGKGCRTDLTTHGMSGYSIITPTAGWNFMPFMGSTKVEQMTPGQVKDGQEKLDPESQLVDYKKKGYKMEYLGKVEIKGADCYKLKVIDKSGRELTWYIDQSNNYPIRSESKVMEDGEEMESATNYSNFQMLPGGIVLAMTVRIEDNHLSGEINAGTYMETKLSKVEINLPVDDSLFVPGE